METLTPTQIQKGKEASPAEGLGLPSKVRRRRGRVVPLDLDAHRQAEASRRRTHPARGKEHHRSRTVRRRRAHREGNAQPAKGKATVREKSRGKGDWNGAVIFVVVSGGRRSAGTLTLDRRGRRTEESGVGMDRMGVRVRAGAVPLGFV